MVAPGSCEQRWMAHLNGAWAGRAKQELSLVTSIRMAVRPGGLEPGAEGERNLPRQSFPVSPGVKAVSQPKWTLYEGRKWKKLSFLH